MMLIYLPTIVHNQSLLWWNVNRIQKVMQSCKKKGWWIDRRREGSLAYTIVTMLLTKSKASKLLSTNALITKWNFYGWEKHSKCEKNVIKHHPKISFSITILNKTYVAFLLESFLCSFHDDAFPTVHTSQMCVTVVIYASLQSISRSRDTLIKFHCARCVPFLT